MNSIEKKKRSLIILAIIVLVIGIAAFAGGVVLTIFGTLDLLNSVYLAGGLKLGFGVLLVILGIIAVAWGIRYIWVGSAIKATKGAIAEENLAKDAPGKNIKKCPHCGCTNSAENTVCSNCQKPLE